MGVAGKGDGDDYNGFVDRGGVGDLTHVVDDDGSIWSSFGIASQPAWAFVDADGKVLSTTTRSLGKDGLTDRINEFF